MKVKLLKNCNHETLGALKKDAEVDVDPAIASLWLELGGCEIIEPEVETKVVKNEYKGGKK